MRVVAVTTATLAFAAWLTPGAGAAMCVTLFAKPEVPTAGVRSEVGLRTYTPYPDGLRARRITSYPFRVQAVAPTGRIYRVVIRPALGNRWVGSFWFPMKGIWTIRVTNFGPQYAEGCGEVLRVRVARRR
jgi:hypothetical protein